VKPVRAFHQLKAHAMVRARVCHPLQHLAGEILHAQLHRAGPVLTSRENRSFRMPDSHLVRRQAFLAMGNPDIPVCIRAAPSTFHIRNPDIPVRNAPFECTC
jgi:hypothetical protein